jgi:hypothetical protein
MPRLISENTVRVSDAPQIGAQGVRALAVRMPLRPAHHHANLSAAALAADQPLSPFWNGHLSAVAFGLFGGIGLYLMAAISAPDDQANAGSGRTA